MNEMLEQAATVDAAADQVSQLAFRIKVAGSVTPEQVADLTGSVSRLVANTRTLQDWVDAYAAQVTERGDTHAPAA